MTQPARPGRTRMAIAVAAAIVGGLAAIGVLTPDETPPATSVTTTDPTPSPVPAPSSVPQTSPVPPTSPTTDGTPRTPSASSTHDIPAAPPARGAAIRSLETLETIPVKGRAPRTGYDRAQFGQAWSDNVSVEWGRNGCDTRNDILRRDLIEYILKPNSQGCTVLSGVLDDPYTGTLIDFERGRGTSAAVQIDHVVALSDAWQKGAQQLTEEQRRDFANDPRNLQATSGPINQQKGNGDAATWLPPNRSYRCTYVARQIEVKALYDLWVTAAERDAMVRILSNCP